MYFIFFQDYDDAAHYSADTMEKINAFMEANDINKEDVWLVEGQMISGIDNKHWPK